MSGFNDLPSLAHRWGGFLASYPARLAWWCKHGYTNENKWTEIIVRDVMNALYGWSLEAEKLCNSAGWDLFDIDNRVLVQVTNQCNNEKVEHSLRETCERIGSDQRFKGFDFYIVFASIEENEIEKLRVRTEVKMDKDEQRERKRGEEPYGFSLENIKFCPAKHILSFDYFITPVINAQITEEQKMLFKKVLDNFDMPFYLPQESAKWNPDERQKFFSNADVLCLGDICNLLEDRTTAWAENLRARFGRTDIDVPKTRAPYPDGFTDQTEFLYEVLPEGTAAFIVRQNVQMRSSIMEGKCHTDVLKEMLKPYRPGNGEMITKLLQACGTFEKGVNRDNLLARLKFLETLIGGRDTEVGDVLRGLILFTDYQYSVRKLAVFVFYAIAGEELFSSYGKKAYFTNDF